MLFLSRSLPLFPICVSHDRILFLYRKKNKLSLCMGKVETNELDEMETGKKGSTISAIRVVRHIHIRASASKESENNSIEPGSGFRLPILTWFWQANWFGLSFAHSRMVLAGELIVMVSHMLLAIDGARNMVLAALFLVWSCCQQHIRGSQRMWLIRADASACDNEARHFLGIETDTLTMTGRANASNVRSSSVRVCAASCDTYIIIIMCHEHDSHQATPFIRDANDVHLFLVSIDANAWSNWMN